MTIDEKLQHFYEVSIEEAKQDASQALEEHRQHLAKMLEDHKQTQRQNAEAQIKAETEHVRREVNKALSAEQINLKRDWSKKQEELKQKLFTEVKEKAVQFMTTPDYEEYLCRKIKEARDVEVQIFLSVNDKDRLKTLIEKTGVPLQISQEDFLGGIRAEIPQKNILIDNSFSENLASMQQEFKFDGGLNHE